MCHTTTSSDISTTTHNMTVIEWRIVMALAIAVACLSLRKYVIYIIKFRL